MEADPVSIEDLDDQEVSVDFKDPEIFVEIDCKSASSSEDISTVSYLKKYRKPRGSYPQGQSPQNAGEA